MSIEESNFILTPMGATDPFDDPDVIFSSKMASLARQPVITQAAPPIQKPATQG